MLRGGEEGVRRNGKRVRISESEMITTKVGAGPNDYTKTTIKLPTEMIFYDQ